MRPLLLLALPGLVACPAGTLYTPGPDSGPADASPDGSCPGPECDDAGICEAVVCAAGQQCLSGVCVAEDMCADVLCPNPSEVCDPRDGTCRPGATDTDGDGYTIADGDCDDGDLAVHPGAEEVCDGVDQDCDREIDEIPPETCTTECGSGESRCLEGLWVCSVPDRCECTPLGLEETEPCGNCGTRRRRCEDWSWSEWSPCGDEGECVPGTTGDCTTGCHSAGTSLCDGDCRWGSCSPPAESCNGSDDDCDGDCDEGCRHRIHRCYSAAAGDHYYTPTAGLCESQGDTREAGGDFFLYSASVSGASDFWQCYHSGAGDHFYTTHPSCEDSVGWVRQASIGFIGSSDFCGAVPLYRMYSSSSSDHFYTTDLAEVTFAESLGYVREYDPGFVWRSE